MNTRERVRVYMNVTKERLQKWTEMNTRERVRVYIVKPHYIYKGYCMNTRERVRVYIIGPISYDPERGLKRALETAELLVGLGFNVFVPHLFTKWDELLYKHPWDFWMEFDDQWMELCHAVFYIDPEIESQGSLLEIAAATRRDIPVFTNIDDLVRHFSKLPGSVGLCVSKYNSLQV